MFIFLFVPNIVIAGDTTVTTTVKQNSNSSDDWTVTSTAETTTDSGETVKWASQEGTTTENLEETVKSTQKDAKTGAEKLAGKKNNGVVAGPDGPGGFKKGKFPPDIIIIVGNPPKKPRSGPDTTIFKYRTQSQLGSRIGKDLDKALRQLQK